MTKLENLHRYISEAYPSGRINELLDATIDTVLEEERERASEYMTPEDGAAYLEALITTN